jgi:hypothetical protein
MISSAILPNVALRTPPTCGPGERAEPFGRETHRPGEAQDAERGHDEEHRVVDARRVAQEDADEADRERSRAGTRGPAPTAPTGWAGRRFGQRRSRGNPSRAGPCTASASAARRRGDASGGLGARGPGGDETVDLGPRGVEARGLLGRSPRARPRTDHEDELPTCRDLARSRGLRKLAKRAARHRLVQLRQLTTHLRPGRSSPQVAASSRSVAATRFGASNTIAPRSSAPIRARRSRRSRPDRGRNPRMSSAAPPRPRRRRLPAPPTVRAAQRPCRPPRPTPRPAPRPDR